MSTFIGKFVSILVTNIYTLVTINYIYILEVIIMSYNLLGKRIKQLRTEMNITLDEMADRMQTTKATLSRYENGLRKPNSDFIYRLSDFFSVSVDYLIGKSDIRHEELINIAKNMKDDEYVKLSNYARDKNIPLDKLKKILDIIDADN
jgi:transcriptional regulator with XRE-family HTH domain